QSTLAEAIGAESDENGALRVGRDQMTTVDGLYAAGDVVSALHQISVAVGHSGVAATAIHNALESNPRRSPDRQHDR
ncbi:MAG: FAD-dependent oxidoreductase, partial [Rhodanobacteraceae bacterium]